MGLLVVTVIRFRIGVEPANHVVEGYLGHAFSQELGFLIVGIKEIGSTVSRRGSFAFLVVIVAVAISTVATVGFGDCGVSLSAIFANVEDLGLRSRPP